MLEISHFLFSRKRPAGRSVDMLRLAGAFVLAACGPELSSPGATNVTGSWQSTAPAGGATSLSIQLSQTADGTITGTWSGTIKAKQYDCPSSTDCALKDGPVTGFNSVLRVQFDLGLSGTFTGQMEAPMRLRGSLTRNNESHPLILVR